MRLLPLLALASLALLAGCITVDVDEPATTEVVQDPGKSTPASPLPESFSESHTFPSSGIQVGGIVVAHEFTLAVPAILHAAFTTDFPEGAIDFNVERDGSTVVDETVPATTGFTRDLQLDPGQYVVSARAFGAGQAKSFTLSGTFEAA